MITVLVTKLISSARSVLFTNFLKSCPQRRYFTGYVRPFARYHVDALGPVHKTFAALRAFSFHGKQYFRYDVTMVSACRQRGARFVQRDTGLVLLSRLYTSGLHVYAISLDHSNPSLPSVYNPMSERRYKLTLRISCKCEIAP